MNKEEKSAAHKKWYLANKDRVLEHQKRYYEKHKDAIKARVSLYRVVNKDGIKTDMLARKDAGYYKALYRKHRLEVINAYGGQCQCCGENKYEFLAIHHGNNDGHEHRKKLAKEHPGSRGTDTMIRWIRRNGFPKDIGITILCANCHNAETFYGECPHKKELLAKS